MTRLGIEPRLPEYIPGALSTELPSLRKQLEWPSTTSISFNGVVELRNSDRRELCVVQRGDGRVGRCSTSARRT